MWQVGHLCNHMAGWGWEPVLVFAGAAGVRVPQRVGEQDGPDFVAVSPYEVLFRRRSPVEP